MKCYRESEVKVVVRLKYVWNERLTWCHLLFLFHCLCAQHVSDINITIVRSLRLFCWINTLVVCSWFDVCWCLQHGHHSNPTTPKHQHTSNQEHTTNVVIQHNSRKLLMIDILMSETCWGHKKWNKNSKWHQVTLLFSAINTINALQWLLVSAFCSGLHHTKHNLKLKKNLTVILM